MALLAGVAMVAVELGLRVAGVGESRQPFITTRTTVRDNPYFGLLAFPRQLARHAPHFLTHRDEEVFRVVVLGESAAMGDPAPVFGMPRQLDVILAARNPERPVEVINAAMTAINSHLILPRARALRALKPDVVVIYMGNNEVIGPFGPGSVFGRPRPSAWVRAQLAMRGTRVGQLVARVADRAAGRESSAHRWHGLALFEERRVALEDPALRAVYRNFASNLADILHAARDAGASVVLCTVAVNERMAPFASDSNAGPDMDAVAQWRSARQHEAEGRIGLARAAFERARDLDTLRVRADSRINAMIREAANANSASVRLVDAAFVLGDQPDAFLDHVHLSFGGNLRLAQLIADAIAPGATPEEAEVARALGFDARAELSMVGQMRERLSRPPYTRQADHRERVAALAARARELQHAPVDLTARAEAIRRAGEARPRDVELALLWGSALAEAGQSGEAIAVFERVLARVPHHTLAHLALADALALAGEIERARRHYELGSPLAAVPRAEALASLGATLADVGRYTEAEPYLRAAVKFAPRHALARYNLALLLSRTGRTGEALAEYDALVRMDPAFSEACNNRALLLHRVGRSAEALAELRRVNEADPDYLPAWRNRAAIAAALGLTNEVGTAWRRAAGEYVRGNPARRRPRRNAAFAGGSNRDRNGNRLSRMLIRIFQRKGRI